MKENYKTKAYVNSFKTENKRLKEENNALRKLLNLIYDKKVNIYDVLNLTYDGYCHQYNLTCQELTNDEFEAINDYEENGLRTDIYLI